MICAKNSAPTKGAFVFPVGSVDLQRTFYVFPLAVIYVIWGTSGVKNYTRDMVDARLSIALAMDPYNFHRDRDQITKTPFDKGGGGGNDGCGGGGGGGRGGGGGGGGGNRGNHGERAKPCFHHNEPRGCTRTTCNFSHECSKCGKKGHGASSCGEKKWSIYF